MDLFVIGGGGGLQQPFFVNNEKKWIDHYSTSQIKRNFHFLECEIINDSLYFNLMMLNKSLDDFTEPCKIKIPLKFTYIIEKDWKLFLTLLLSCRFSISCNYS